MNQGRPARQRDGFTLIELLVVIAIVAVLLSLTLVWIRSVKARARESATLATLRQHLAIFSLYSQDYRESHHWAGAPSATGQVSVQPPGDGGPFDIYYFQLSESWTVLMAGYYGDMWPHPSQSSPQSGLGTRYLYSCAMMTDPLYWRASTRVGPSQWRATKTGEVTKPSHKMLMVAAMDHPPYPGWVKDGVVSGFSDGSGAQVLKRSLAMPFDEGDGPSAGVFHIRGYYGLDTVGGVQGADVAAR